MEQGLEQKREIGISVIIGAFDGIFSGLSGVGGGAILVPLLVNALKVPQHRAHGTSLAIIVLVALAGVPVYALEGAVDWLLAAQLAAGSVFGVIIGAKLMLRATAPQLRRMFGLFLALVAIRMFLG